MTIELNAAQIWEIQRGKKVPFRQGQVIEITFSEFLHLNRPEPERTTQHTRRLLVWDASFTSFYPFNDASLSLIAIEWQVLKGKAWEGLDIVSCCLTCYKKDIPKISKQPILKYFAIGYGRDVDKCYLVNKIKIFGRIDLSILISEEEPKTEDHWVTAQLPS